MRRANPDKIKRDIGGRVAELRRERGLTQEKFAEKLGVSVKYLQRVEGGRENLTIESLVNLANLLGTPFTELFTAPAPRPKKLGRPPKSG